jgi:acetylornithine deacetylase/succinyl-diaminopimelate desuccinylase family protein
MARFVSDLVALPTENPPGSGCRACLSRIEDELETLGLPHEVLPVPGGDLDPENPRYWLRSDWGRGPAVYFHGHYDVVPAADTSQFEPRVTEQTIFGRGSTDMKGGLASMIYAMKILAESGARLEGRIALRVVPDEETGGHLGSRRLSDEGVLFDRDALCMLTAEPTGGVVWHASRGALTLRVEIRGREAHVGQAHLGVNAFVGMIRVAEPLARLSESLRERGGSPLVVGGVAGSGAGFNVVPGSAWFSVDRRLDPDEDVDTEVARLKGTIERAAAEAGAAVTVDVLQEQPAASTDPAHPAAEALARSVAAVEGEWPRFELCPGVLETRWYAQLGVPAFAYGPGALEISHGPDEDVEEEAIRRCAAVYALVGAELLA